MNLIPQQVSPLTPESAEEIFNKHILGNEIIDDDNLVCVCWPDGNTCGSECDFLDLQERIVLRNCGTIDPESIKDYEEAGGYQGVKKALTEMTPSEIIQTIKDSGLRGRGGAGFPTGLKWSFAAANEGEQKYVVCNAYEGDPGAFMDRSVLECDPHAILEGMIICARAKVISFIEEPFVIRRILKQLDLWEDPRTPPEPLELVCEPCADYVPWQDDVPEIEVG